MLSLGVTGHRPNKLQRADLSVLHSTIHSALLAMQQIQRRRIVSSLAEGADRMVVQEALGLGWQLEAVLPYAAREHAGEFSESSLLEFRTLLDRASALLELHGEPRTPAAYHAAGLAMLTGSDMLLAVWDGEPASGEGGTAEIVAAARERQMPVVHIDSRAPHHVRLWHSSDGLELVSDGLAQLPQALSRILGTPPPRPA